MANYKTKAELDFEKEVVNQLTVGHNQWVERKDLYEATPEQLWANLREKINNNNYAVLQGQPLTDQEFGRVQRAIEVQTPYEAAQLLAAENGIGKIVIERDDAQLDKVTLELFWKADVAGGKSSYEIVRQAVRPKGTNINGDDQDRRFDVTLLINGLPLIQLEFKKSTVELGQAFTQIKKYAAESKYTGIYSLLQMFVIMSPDSSAYFANCEPGHFNDSFIFHWRTRDNKPVEDGLKFTQQVLNIPMAHKLVSEYTVMDEERKSLILLRPYQIYAIQAVMERIHEHKNGFVWHTTGSGKTLTSYKTAKLAAQDPSVDRVIFLLDRKDLDEQTTSNFSAYAANDDMQVNEAQNTSDLIKKLLSNDGKVLIASIQKMHRAVQRQQESIQEGKQSRWAKLFEKRIVFFVDEAHRSQFGKMQKEIREAFYNSNWYGYTGTPIFLENKKAIKGDLAVTTEELFGPVCHTYNIRDALEDQAVLPFNVEHVNTINKDTLVKRAFEEEKKKITAKRFQQNQPVTTNDLMNVKKQVRRLTDLELEKYLVKTDFEKDEHRHQVAAYILKNGPRKTSLGHGNFNAILTTSSIKLAQQYYQLFKAMKNDPEYQNEADPDWPRIAITYSLTENDDQSDVNRQQMSTVLKDYNQQYGTHFDLDTLALYNEDVAKRAARREDSYAHLTKNQEINLVIVVKRLLTGFDAPRLNTLFVDRVLEYQELIQAYSRTNRLQDKELKQEGQIVTFRMPATMEANEEEAYKLYSGEGTFDLVTRPSYTKAVAKFKETVTELKTIAPIADAVDDLKGTADKVAFVKAFRKMNTQLNSLSMYTDFTWEDSQKNFGLVEDEVQHYAGKFNRIKSELPPQPSDDDPLSNLDFSLSVGSVTLVDYDYITDLIQDWLDQQQKYLNKELAQENMSDYLQSEADIQEKINQFAKDGHPMKAEVLRAEWANAQKQSAENKINHAKGLPVRPLIAKELNAEYEEEQIRNKVEHFAYLWGLKPSALLRVANEHPIDSDVWEHEQELTESADVDKAKAAQEQDAAGLQFNGPLPIYRIKAKNAWRNFITEDLAAYLTK
ncbi:MAG: HsdR family type I site-specific deoxyribonuclease [Oenococcus sp.]|uniref:type I restriction endonuclease subunit R n=1 Tax=Oenococcus sp. TaxID=1979414 RepID=UPI0039ED1877